MASWDVFHGDRLEVERGLDDAAVRSALDRGDLTEDDLIRPGGSGAPWERLGDRLDHLDALVPPVETKPTPLDVDSVPTNPNAARLDQFDLEAEGLEILDEPDFEHVDPEISTAALLSLSDETPAILDKPDVPAPSPPSAIASRVGVGVGVGTILPPVSDASSVPSPGPSIFDEHEYDAAFADAEIDEEEYDPLEEDEAVAEFTLARGAAETVEELDLAAMVDVAFQLVLFFLVTATTILYKSLEVPKPNNDAPPEAAAQGRSKSIDDLKADFILVEIDPSGTLKIDRQPVPGGLTMQSLAEKLRTLRTDTGRQAMLLSADFATPHKNAVLAYDAANEIGMRIAIAKPANPNANAAPPPVAKKG